MKMYKNDPKRELSSKKKDQNIKRKGSFKK